MTNNCKAHCQTRRKTGASPTDGIASFQDTAAAVPPHITSTIDETLQINEQKVNCFVSVSINMWECAAYVFVKV